MYSIKVQFGMTDDMHEPLWVHCSICNQNTSEANAELNNFITAMCKKHTLSVAVSESICFLKILNENRAKKRKMEHESIVYTKIDMLKHIRFCVASRDNNVRMIIARNEIMELLVDSVSSKEKIQALGLLLKTVSSEKIEP